MRTFLSFFSTHFRPSQYSSITLFFRKFSQIFLDYALGPGSPRIFFSKYLIFSFLIERKFFHFEIRIIFIIWTFIERGNCFEYLINWDIWKQYFFYYFFIRIQSGFFFYFCIFSRLDSRNNRWITTKKQRLDS